MNELYSFGDFGKEICYMKRFFESMSGDIDFYNSIMCEPESASKTLEARGILGIDLDQMLSIWPNIFDLENISVEEISDKPQVLLRREWLMFAKQVTKERRKLSSNTLNDNFNKWQEREIKRCHGQLGKETNSAIIHGIVAFELSKGCSFNCPFCGLDAGPFEGAFMYTEENSRFWKEILNLLYSKFGEPLGLGICYWGTDPTDNPDYFKFLNDFGEATGIYPQTTTAGPLRNIKWTRELLDFRKKHITSYDRFSILSKNMLTKVHEIFSAEDLAFTNLNLQYIDQAKASMAVSGRNRKNDMNTNILEDHTIACVTGYLINMVKGSIQLISPYPPSEENPFGYKIYEEGNFSSASELNDFIDFTIDKYMKTEIQENDILAFRKDLKYKSLESGFQLDSKYKSTKMTGEIYLKKLGDLIAESNLTHSNIINQMMKEYPNIFKIINSIQKLFEQGLLEGVK